MDVLDPRLCTVFYWCGGGMMLRLGQAGFRAVLTLPINEVAAVYREFGAETAPDPDGIVWSTVPVVPEISLAALDDAYNLQVMADWLTHGRIYRLSIETSP